MQSSGGVSAKAGGVHIVVIFEKHTLSRSGNLAASGFVELSRLLLGKY